jgi:putative ABC transport system permease protein
VRLGTALFEIVESVRMGFDSIRANKVRAALTILGVSIGMFVVVALSAVVHGLRTSIFSDFQSAGPTSFFVYDFMPQLGDGEREDRDWPWITLAEARAIEKLPTIAAVTAHSRERTDVRFEMTTLDTRVAGYSYGWPGPAGASIIDGRDFSRVEEARSIRVALINVKLRDRLFPGVDPIGKTIVFRGTQVFTVIGVYRDNTSLLGKPTRGDPFENEAVVPITTALRTLHFYRGNLDLTVQPNGTASQADAIDDVTGLLRALRGLRASDRNNFAVMTSESLMKIVNSFSGVFFAVMISISAIGLLVGGIGVIAIMTITVTERTREIGIRKALGATHSTILWQFLMEAATLTGVGAALGLMGGAAIALLVAHFSPVPASVPPIAVVLALVASAGTGMVFGLAPALRAARMDPVEALRFE